MNNKNIKMVILIMLILMITLSSVSAGSYASNIIAEGEMQYKHAATGVIDGLSVSCTLFAILFVVVMIKLKNTHKQIKRNKVIDSETGIGNLVYFERCYNIGISDDVRDNYHIAYIIIDSSYLQVYHGEAVFLDFVKYTAGVLHYYESDDGFAARITENGFVYVFRKSSEEETQGRIAEMINKLNSYVSGDNKRRRPFFYVAAYNLKKTDKSCELLLFNLRKNCNKLIGTDRQLVVCEENMMDKAAEEKELLESISRGFKNEEFKLYLQFIVDNKTKKIMSAEALSRWNSPDKGILGPGNYIQLMEETGLIVEFDYYMFERTCRQLHKWKDTEFDHMTISCNFTRITISENDFVERIKEIANKYVFDKSQLIIEITEDAIEKNMKNALENIAKCKKLGFKIALDDMGSGYTSLINLCEYPIDIVKIDREILLKTQKMNGKHLFAGIIALSHNLGLKVVCEGVETDEQNELVSSLECDYIQGWYYSKVLPRHEGEEYARAYTQKLLA